MDAWLPGRRIVRDLDLLGLGTLSEAKNAIESLCTADGASEFVIMAVESIWEETASPGLRYQIGPDVFQLDVATGDPLVVPPTLVQIEDLNVPCCTPEIMYGWKVHGLFERGEGRWRPRDLWDIYLLQTCLTLDAAILPKSVEIAFVSRNASFEITQRFFGDSWGRSRGSQRKWSKFCRETGAQSPVIADLYSVKNAVAAKLAPIIQSINPPLGETLSSG